MNQKTRDQIREACFFFGRPKTVALKAGVDVSNFSKWLRGKPALSSSNIDRVLNVLGLPHSKPDCSRVHLWWIDSPPMAGISAIDIHTAFSLYLPKGGKIARAPWGKRGLANLLPRPHATYALTDGNIRAVLRLDSMLLLQSGQVRAPFKWRNGTEAKSILNVSDLQDAWTTGTPSIEEFDRAWNDPTPPAMLQDLLDAIRGAGITYSEAIRRIRKFDE